MLNNQLSYNKQMIIKNADAYINKYEEKFGARPTDWFSYQRWLAQATGAGYFTIEDSKLSNYVLNGTYEL
jgi:hypothetical protein